MHIEIQIRYSMVVTKSAGTAYGVSFPDFPGCISSGETIDEAIWDGCGALALHLKGISPDYFPRPMSASASKAAMMLDPPGEVMEVVFVTIGYTMQPFRLQRIRCDRPMHV